MKNNNICAGHLLWNVPGVSNFDLQTCPYPHGLPSCGSALRIYNLMHTQTPAEILDKGGCVLSAGGSAGPGGGGDGFGREPEQSHGGAGGGRRSRAAVCRYSSSLPHPLPVGGGAFSVHCTQLQRTGGDGHRRCVEKCGVAQRVTCACGQQSAHRSGYGRHSRQGVEHRNDFGVSPMR